MNTNTNTTKRKLPAGIRQLPSGSFRAEIMAGTRHSQTFPTMKAAVEWRAGIAARHERGDRLARRGAITLGQFWDEFDATHRDPSTAAKQRSYWTSRIRPAWGNTAMRAVTGPALDVWAAELANDGLAESTIRSILYVVSAMFREAIRHGYVESNPRRLMGKRPPIEETESRILTDDEFDRLLAAAPDDSTRALLIVLRDTGARIGEASAIPARNVLDRKIVLSQRNDRATTAVKPRLKNGDRRRDAPLTERTRAALAPLLDGKSGSDLLFVGKRGGKLNLRDWSQHVWWPMVEAANLPDPQPTPHDLRKTFATALGKAGLPAHKLRDALGQRDSRSLDRYLIGDDDLVDEIAAMQDARAAERRRANIRAAS
jgi:integrase